MTEATKAASFKMPSVRSKKAHEKKRLSTLMAAAGTKGQAVDRLATPDRSALIASVSGDDIQDYQPLLIEGEYNG